MSRQQQISNADSKKPKKNTRRSTAQHRRRTGTATPTHPSTSRQSYKAFDSISMFAAVERGTARTPWEFSIPRSSLENEGCTGARRQLQSPAIKSTPSATPSDARFGDFRRRRAGFSATSRLNIPRKSSPARRAPRAIADTPSTRAFPFRHLSISANLSHEKTVFRAMFSCLLGKANRRPCVHPVRAVLTMRPFDIQQRRT